MPVRVMMGKLDALTGGTNQYGLYVAGPDGTTIIDGTSDVFRVAATGTLSLVGPNGSPGVSAGTSTSVLLSTGLTYSPAFSAFGSLTSAPTSTASLMPVFYFLASGVTDQVEYATTVWSADDQTSVTFGWIAMSNQSANTDYMRFYIYEQVAL